MRGCVTKRRGKWCFVVEMGKHPVTGRRRQKWYSSFATKVEAEKELSKVLHELSNGTHVEPTKETLGNFFTNTWLPHKKQHVRPGTYQTYSRFVNGHILPRLGQLNLNKLTPQILIQMYEDMQFGNRKLAPQTIKHIHRVLYDGMETAVKFGITKNNPLRYIKGPKVPRAEMRIWTAAELQQFLEIVKPTRYFVYFLILATTGMRRGELLALRWADIDLDAAKLTVRRSLSRGYEGRFIIQEPKTTSSIRTVALPQQTVAALRQHKIVQAKDKLATGGKYKDEGYIAQTQLGKLMNPQQLEEAWYKALKFMDKKIRLHDLRHCHASLLLQKGIHIKVVSERLGHSSVTITLDRYSHLLPGMQELAAQKFNEILEDKPASAAHHQ